MTDSSYDKIAYDMTFLADLIHDHLDKRILSDQEIDEFSTLFQEVLKVEKKLINKEIRI